MIELCMLCTMAHKRKNNIPTFEQKKYKYAHRVAEAEQAGMTLKDYMKGKPRWGNLHGHSEFSLLDGGAKIEDIMDKVKAMGQDFVAITDHGSMFGAVKAHAYAHKIGIKHIVGCELYLTPVGKSRFDKDFKRGERAYHHLVVLAKNEVGYRNLCQLTSLGYEEGFYRVPRVDRELLERHKEGLIVTSSCIGGSIPMNAVEGDFYKAEKDLEWMATTFGDDFYIEIQNHGTEIEDRGFTYMREVAQKHGLQMVATTDAHYLDEQDEQVHDALICIGTGQFVDDTDRKFKFEGRGFHYHAQEEVEALFPHDKDAIYTAGEIADKIDDQVIDFNSGTKMPVFEVPEDSEYQAWKKKGGYSLWLPS